MFGPLMVNVSICCRRRDATWALASLFVAKMVVISKLKVCQEGRRKPKKSVTKCTTIAKTMEKLRVKNGILLTMKPGEQTGLIIDAGGRKTWAQISEVNIATAVMPQEKCMNIAVNIAIAKLFSCPTKPPVKKYTLLKRAPGSRICAKRKKNPT